MRPFSPSLFFHVSFAGQPFYSLWIQVVTRGKHRQFFINRLCLFVDRQTFVSSPWGLNGWGLALSSNTMKRSEPKILVVDDDATNVMVLDSMLREEGYSTVTASNGKTAIEAAVSESPDLILLDIMMPDMDGFEACRRLQQDSITTDLPIIFLSALDDVENKVLAFNVGAVDYIGKPFQKQEVLARVRLHLKLSMSMRAAVAAQAEKFRQLQDAQQAILVLPEDLPEAKFGVSYSPLQEVGGDFYDVLNVSDTIFGYLVADISGHDIGASFTTPAIKVLLAQHASPLFTAVETLKNVNSVLHTIMRNGNHITASYVQLNRAAGQLQVVNAGHPPMLFVPKEGDCRYLEAVGDVLGVFKTVCFDTVEQSVSEGDRFFIYSDGLVESFSHAKKSRAEGLETLARAVMDNNDTDRSIAETVDRIYHAVLPADAILEDDVVLLGVEV